MAKIRTEEYTFVTNNRMHFTALYGTGAFRGFSALGEIFGLLGPNGAGKSTTVGILTTRVRPTGGQAWIGEYDVWKEQVAVKRLIGVVPQRPNLDFALTAREILLFHGAYFGMEPRECAQRA